VFLAQKMVQAMRDGDLIWKPKKKRGGTDVAASVNKEAKLAGAAHV
jgi:hypothetical protein